MTDKFPATHTGELSDADLDGVTGGAGALGAAAIQKKAEDLKKHAQEAAWPDSGALAQSQVVSTLISTAQQIAPSTTDSKSAAQKVDTNQGLQDKTAAAQEKGNPGLLDLGGMFRVK